MADAWTVTLVSERVRTYRDATKTVLDKMTYVLVLKIEIRASIFLVRADVVHDPKLLLHGRVDLLLDDGGRQRKSG